MKRTHDIRSSVLLESAGLEPGDEICTVCPACGRNAKFYLSVMDDGLILYICFRASCAISGAVSPAGHYPGQSTLRPGKSDREPYSKPLVPLPDDIKDILRKVVHFDDEHITESRAAWSPDDRRVAYPLLNPAAKHRGYSLRSYNGEYRKALLYPLAEEPHLSYYGASQGDWAIVVEDIPSAIRAARYMRAVALSGTHCSMVYAAEIAAHCKKVVFALDADATQSAIRLQARHSLLFDDSAVLVLSKDLKDMEEGELCWTLTDYVST